LHLAFERLACKALQQSKPQLSVPHDAREFSLFKEFMIGMGVLVVVGSAVAHPNDLAWTAFVAQYDSNSKVVAQRSVRFVSPVEETAAITADMKKFKQVWADKFTSVEDAAIIALLDDDYMAYGWANPQNKAQFLADFPPVSKRPAQV